MRLYENELHPNEFRSTFPLWGGFLSTLEKTQDLLPAALLFLFQFGDPLIEPQMQIGIGWPIGFRRWRG
jgi:hypothetical protein